MTTIPLQDIEKIIAAGADAPSGHNAQPWEFVVSGDTIHIVNLPEEDQTIFNFKQNGSFIAHGAVLENMILASREYGYRAMPIFDSQMNVQNSLIVLRLEPRKPEEEISKNPLFPFIKTRQVNRTLYDKKKPLTADEKSKLLACVNGGGEGGFPRGELRFVEDSERKKILGKAFALNEQMLFENFTMHQAVFPHLNWTAEEEEGKRKGLYVKTLGLPPPVQFLFRAVFRFWNAAKFLGNIGFGKMVAKQNAEMYASSPAIAAIVFRDDSPASYVAAGRLLERVWLTATMLGIDMAPLAGTLFVSKKILSGNANHEFSPAHIHSFQKEHQAIYKAFGVKENEGNILMIFRLGHGTKPEAHSLRAKPRVRYV